MNIWIGNMLPQPLIEIIRWRRERNACCMCVLILMWWLMDGCGAEWRWWRRPVTFDGSHSSLTTAADNWIWTVWASVFAYARHAIWHPLCGKRRHAQWAHRISFSSRPINIHVPHNFRDSQQLSDKAIFTPAAAAVRRWFALRIKLPFILWDMQCGYIFQQEIEEATLIFVSEIGAPTQWLTLKVSSLEICHLPLTSTSLAQNNQTALCRWTHSKAIRICIRRRYANKSQTNNQAQAILVISLSNAINNVHFFHFRTEAKTHFSNSFFFSAILCL